MHGVTPRNKLVQGYDTPTCTLLLGSSLNTIAAGWMAMFGSMALQTSMQAVTQYECTGLIITE